MNTTNDTMSITNKSFKTNESINDTKTEASEVWIFSEGFQPPPELIPSRYLKEDQEETNESDISIETTSEEERNKMVTKTIMEKKNDTMVEIEREHIIEKMEQEQEEEQEEVDESDMHNGVQQGMEEKNVTLVENQQDRFDELKQLMIQLMQQNDITYKETEDNECKKVMNAMKQKKEIEKWLTPERPIQARGANLNMQHAKRRKNVSTCK